MQIVNNVKISSPQLTLKEGILANDDILTFEEFKTFMLQQLNENVIKSMLSRFNQIAGHIRGGRYRKAYLMWENFEKDILLNKNYSVSLLLIENINADKKLFNYKYATKEYDVLSDRGKLTKLSQLNKKLMKENVEAQISDHLAEFITDVETRQMPYKFIKQIFKIGDSEVKRNGANARWRTHNWSYKNILYGENPVWQGNVADAFMNHMAHLHVQLIAAENVEQQNLFATSVFNEERDNIFNLLYASKNNTSWITGGDIIIKYGGQIYNIQLKTSQQILNDRRRSRIGGKLAVQDLLHFIEDIKLSIQTQNIEEIIQKMYNELQTSGWVENTSNIIDDVSNELIQSLI